MGANCWLVVEVDGVVVYWSCRYVGNGGVMGMVVFFDVFHRVLAFLGHFRSSPVVKK